MKILPNHDVECCDPDCTAHGVTSVKGDLPLGWTFRLIPGDDEEEARMLIYCPACSAAREQAQRSSGEEKE
jgi:hypothetical protein